MSQSRHVMILASAGSGKTYALTSQFVRLLAEGAKPERIVALTFTRKAAGEFFDEILNKLAKAAQDETVARELAREIGHPALRTRDFLRMLRAVTDAMHRLRLGTLDSFFARIARAFPLELGLAGDFEILQEHAARLERQRVLRRMFTRTGELAEAQKEFVEAFKRATFGADEKRLGLRLDAFLDQHQEIFLAASDRGLWGQPGLIWPDGSAWLREQGKLAEAIDRLRTELSRLPLAEKQRERWERFFSGLAEMTPGTLPDPVAYILKNALAIWPELRRGAGEITIERKKVSLGPDASAALMSIVISVIQTELQRRLETTRGIHAVLEGYEGTYHDAVRRTGKLTFGDVQRLLVPGAGARLLTREADAAGRMFIDFRLDAEIDHWLLDEFQDTSFGQWSVLRNLVDEAVQDPEGVRSFFCVGDVKQAIFTWREGDPRLFREILRHYNAAAADTVSEKHLVNSFRSGPPLIEMVNAVFGAKDVFAALFPGPASETWNDEWRAHTSARPKQNGQAAWLHAEDDVARWKTMLRVLQEIEPLKRGLSCAVLVKTNAAAAALADYLRHEGRLPAIAESDLHVCTDNPLGAALLALMKAAAHPGDSLAARHVAMSPLGPILTAENLTSAESLTRHVLAQVHGGGFERTVETWLKKLEPALAEGDAFSRQRARQFAAAAGLFDAGGSRDVAEFIQFMERHTVRDVESPAAIRVMTIHKSKGLGFDVVLLPDLEGNRLDERRAGLAVQKNDDRSVRWIMDLPPKIFWEHDEVLSAHVRAAEAEAGYEALSLLYVAMTRAKRAMYVITSPPRNSSSRNFPKVLTETLGDAAGPINVGAQTFTGGWTAGDPNWHAGVVAQEEKAAEKTEIALVDESATRIWPRRVSRLPSGEKAGGLPAAQVFVLENTAGAEFGTQVHALFAEVEWLAAEEMSLRESAWRERGMNGEAVDEVIACLRAPALSALWTNAASAKTSVWRERGFEIVIDDVWVTGVFDRVVVETDASGRAVRAAVIDFKTDRVGEDADLAEAAARHAPQLNLYRRVVARLAALPEENITAEVIFTRRRERVRIV